MTKKEEKLKNMGLAATKDALIRIASFAVMSFLFPLIIAAITSCQEKIGLWGEFTDLLQNNVNAGGMLFTGIGIFVAVLIGQIVQKRKIMDKLKTFYIALTWLILYFAIFGSIIYILFKACNATINHLGVATGLIVTLGIFFSAVYTACLSAENKQEAI